MDEDSVWFEGWMNTHPFGAQHRKMDDRYFCIVCKDAWVCRDQHIGALEDLLDILAPGWMGTLDQYQGKHWSKHGVID